MYSGQGFKAEGYHPAHSSRREPTDNSEPKASQVVTLRSVEIPEIVESLQGFHRLASSADAEKREEKDGPVSFRGDIVESALQARRLIGHFIASNVHTPEQIGFRPIHEQPERPEPGRVIDSTPKKMYQQLEALESQLEYALVSPPENPFIAEVVPHLHEQLSDVMQLLRSAWDGQSVREDMTEAVSYQLLDLRGLLTSVALESKSRELAEGIQADLAVCQAGQSGDAKVLTVSNDSLLASELMRQEELRQEMLPEVQRSVSQVVNALIDFITELREQEPAPFGFSLNGGRTESEALTVDGVVDALEVGNERLEEMFWSLDQEVPMDMNYRAYLHNIGHHINVLRVALLRQNAHGVVGQGSVSTVQSQCEATLRKVTGGLKQLTEVARADVQELMAGELDEVR